MIEYVIIGTILICILVFLIIFAYTMYRKEEIKAEIAYNKYRIEKRKLPKASKGKDEDIDDEVEEFIESLPSWLSSIFEGANIDLEKVYEGDKGELIKVKDILDKNLKTAPGAPGSAGDLIG